VEKRIKRDLETKGDFARVHATPHASQDVQDVFEAGLVVLGLGHPYSKEPSSPAETEAKAILSLKGNVPRTYQNALVFLAADKTRLQDLDEAVRSFLAWESILSEKEQLNLTPHQVKQAETRRSAADGTVKARLPETYQWLLVPTQQTPQSAVDWQAIRLTGQDALAPRAGKKLRNEELLFTALAGTRLRMELDRVPLWRGDSVSVRQLAEDFARYCYLPRLSAPSVLIHSIRDGAALLTWETDSFAFADSYDEASGRYMGLHAGQHLPLGTDDLRGLLIRAEVARRQLDADSTPPPDKTTPATESTEPDHLPLGATQDESAPRIPPPSRPRRFFGSVRLSPTRLGKDAASIAEEVVAHLQSQKDAEVEVTLEIHARVPEGASESLVRTVTENARTLKFDSMGFEEE